jgi:hypothetical protein
MLKAFSNGQHSTAQSAVDQIACYGGLNAVYTIYKNSMVWIHERTVPTERPPLVGEAIANFYG